MPRDIPTRINIKYDQSLILLNHFAVELASFQWRSILPVNYSLRAFILIYLASYAQDRSKSVSNSLLLKSIPT